MANEDVPTLGIELVYGTAGGDPATELGGIRNIDSLPNLNFDEYDKSEIDQDSIVKQFAMTLADAGMLGVTLSMTEDRLTTLYGLYDRKDRAWGILLPNGGKIVFDGPLKRVGNTAGGTNAPLLVQIEVRVNTMPVYTPPPEE